jgi:hypothetical protein
MKASQRMESEGFGWRLETEEEKKGDKGGIWKLEARVVGRGL